MPVDASIALQGRAPQIDNPINYLMQAQQLQQAQNQNSLFPMMQQEQRLKLAQAQRMGDLMQQYYGMFRAPGNALAAAQPGAAATPQGTNALAATPGSSTGTGAPMNALAAGPSSFPMSMQQVAAANMLGLPGAKEMVDLYKYSNDGINIPAGSFRKDPGTGAISYFADPTKGFGFDPGTGSVSALPGFAQANAGIEGAKSAATTRAVNDNTVADPTKYISADGRPFTGTVGQLVNTASGKPANSVAPRFVGADLLDQLPPAQAAALRDQIAKAGGKASINLNTPDGTHVQGDVDLTRAAGGYTPPSVTATGQPMPQQMQAVLSSLAATRDPAKLKAFETATLSHIAQTLGGTNGQLAAQQLRDEVQKIAQSWQAPGGQGGQQPSGFSFASPNDIELDKQRREAALKQDTEPMLKFRTDLLTKAHDSNSQTLGKLQDTVRSEFEIQNRNKQLLPMLDKIQTGGFTPEGRIDLANKLQTSGLVPDALKGTLSTWIASGDPTTGKVIENQLAAAGIKTMLDTLDKEGKPNRAIFDAIQNAQESVKSGNATLKEVFALQKQVYDMHYQQEQDMAHAIASPDYNPLTMQAEFSKRRNAALASDRPLTASAQAPAAAAAPAAQGGWSIKRVK